MDSKNRPDRLLNRRDAVRIGAAGVGLTLLPNADLANANPINAAEPDDLIDAHVHVWTPDTKKFPLKDGFNKSDMQPPSFTPSELMAHAKPNGIGRIVLIQMSFYGFDNSYMLKTMQDYPGVYAGVAVVDEHDDPVSAMKHLAGKDVKGFRIRPGKQKPNKWLASDSMGAMWKCAAEQELLMCHLIDPEYLPSVDRMCEKFPRTPVVIDHFARIGIDGTIRNTDLENLCRLARFPHVSVKVSAYYALGKKKRPYTDLGPMIQRLIKEFGPERLMWASDCPFQVQGDHTYKASIDLIKNELAFLTPNDKAWILKKTAERVFFS